MCGGNDQRVVNAIMAELETERLAREQAVQEAALAQQIATKNQMLQNSFFNLLTSQPESVYRLGSQEGGVRSVRTVGSGLQFKSTVILSVNSSRAQTLAEARNIALGGIRNTLSTVEQRGPQDRENMEKVIKRITGESELDKAIEKQANCTTSAIDIYMMIMESMPSLILQGDMTWGTPGTMAEKTLLAANFRDLQFTSKFAPFSGSDTDIYNPDLQQSLYKQFEYDKALNTMKYSVNQLYNLVEYIKHRQASTESNPDVLKKDVMVEMLRIYNEDAPTGFKINLEKPDSEDAGLNRQFEHLKSRLDYYGLNKIPLLIDALVEEGYISPTRALTAST